MEVLCVVAPLAQLDRASGYEPEGREFESLRARHFPLLLTTAYAKAEYRSCNKRENSYPQIYPQGTVPTVLFSDLAAPAENVSR